MKNKYFYFFLILAVLPILIFRDYTPDNELRYLSIVDEALRNGNFFTFTNHGLPYADKPPLYFWIIMFGKALFGQHQMWFLSLFSFLPALVVVYVMDLWVSKEVSVENRWLGKIWLMSCGLFLGSAIVLRMDMLMCMFIVLALYAFYKMYKGQSGLITWLFPFFIFMAVFSKGPVGFLIPFVSTTVYLLLTNRLSTFTKYWGWKTWSVLLLGFSIWFLGVYWEGGMPYLNNLVFHQTLDRAVKSFHHEEPFYYYFISIWYSLAPWAILVISVIVLGLSRRLMRTDLQKFFSVIILTTLLTMSLVSAKLSIYLLPTFPFFVYLAVTLMHHFKWNRWLALSLAIPYFVFVTILPVFLWLIQQEDGAYLNQSYLYISASLLTVSGLYALYALYRKEISRSVYSLGIGLFVALFIGGLALPSINHEIGYGELCRKAVSLSEEKQLSGYHVFKIRRPENMDVYLHESVKEITQEDLKSLKLQNTLLLLKSGDLLSNKELSEIVLNKEKYEVGRYMIVVF